MGTSSSLSAVCVSHQGTQLIAWHICEVAASQRLLFNAPTVTCADVPLLGGAWGGAVVLVAGDGAAGDGVGWGAGEAAQYHMGWTQRGLGCQVREGQNTHW